MKLSKIPTDKLIKELEKRPEIKSVEVGLYREYSLIRKYTYFSEEISSDKVLVVNPESDL